MEGKLSISKAMYGEVSSFSAARRQAILGAVAEHFFSGAEPDFRMYDAKASMKRAYDKIIQRIEADIEEDAIHRSQLEERIDDLEFLLTPGAISKELMDAFIRDYIEDARPFPVSEADDIINSMLYQDFLQTPYWKSIARYIKQRDGNRCRLCGSEQWLLVHHTSYLHHGDELHHLEDLQTVCGHCHQQIHPEYKNGL